MLLRQLFESQQNKTAVLGWGRGMGHKGHMLLAKAVLHHAQENQAKPYFVVSRTSLVDPSTGQPWADKPTFTKTKDDPLTPDEKLATYRKVFPQNADVFSVATADATKLEQVMAKIAREGFNKVILVVGEDQKASMGYLTRPDKSGVPPYKQSGIDELEIISRQDTTEPSSMRGSPEYQEGPRATPMRQVLLDPSKSEEEQFAVWRRDMPDNLSDEEVRDLMLKAKQRMSAVPAAKKPGKKDIPGGVAEAAKWRADDLEGKTWRSPDWDDGDLSPSKIKIDRSGKDIDDSGDELTSRPGAWRGKADMAKRMTKKGVPTKSELAFQDNLKMRMRMKKKEGGLTGPKGVLPEQGVAEGLDDLQDSVSEVLKTIYRGASAGENMIDYLADEFGQYYDEVEASGDQSLQNAYSYMMDNGQEAEDNPQAMAKIAKRAFFILKQGVAELSDKTKDAYKTAAQAQIADLEPWTKKGEYKDLAKNVIARRQRGLDRLDKKLVPVSEDVEQIMTLLVEQLKNK